MDELKHRSGKLFWAGVLCAHLLLLCFFYYRGGMSLGNEGDKYLSSAELLCSGRAADAFSYQIFYSSYISYLGVLLLLHVPAAFIPILTWALSLIAVWKMHITLSERMPLIAARIFSACLLLSPMIQVWQLTLYSEVFYISLSLLFIAALFRKEESKKTVPLFLLGLLLCFARPAGIFTVSAFVLAFLLHQGTINRQLLRAGFTLLIASIFIVLVFFIPMHFRGVCMDIASGAIYAGFPTLGSSSITQIDQTVASCYDHLLQQHGPLTVAKLLLLKFLSFFNLNRPYFTGAHNLLNALHYLFYPLALWTLFQGRSNESVAAYLVKACLLVVLLNALLVGFFFNEWSERYTVQVFPFILMAASFALSLILKRSKPDPAL